MAKTNKPVRQSVCLSIQAVLKKHNVDAKPAIKVILVIAGLAFSPNARVTTEKHGS